MPETTATTGSTSPGVYGAKPGGVVLAPALIERAWNMQAHSDAAAVSVIAQRLFAIGLPLVPNTTVRAAGVVALWLGPASWLVVSQEIAGVPNFREARDAVNAAGGALFDVSASRVAWTLSGPHAANVLAKSCPLDFHASAFAAGRCAQSVYGHVNALIDKRDETPTFTLMVARSFAHDVWQHVCESAAQYGYEVRADAPFG